MNHNIIILNFKNNYNLNMHKLEKKYPQFISILGSHPKVNYLVTRAIMCPSELTTAPPLPPGCTAAVVSSIAGKCPPKHD